MFGEFRFERGSSHQRRTMANAFLDNKENEENGDFNQYWYSAPTIARIVEAMVATGGSIAFLSTPSLYFSLPDDLRAKAYVFDYDKKWEADRGFVFYDFNAPDAVPVALHGTFDLVVVDPPFITHEVWEKYAVTAKLLMKSGTAADGTPAGKVHAPWWDEKTCRDPLSPPLSLPSPALQAILTTVAENADLLKGLFDAAPTAFLPSIPHLVYQYNLYTNFPSEAFSKKNPEIPE